MKRVAIITVVAAIMMASCGGGATKSGLKKNEHLGKIPALYADYSIARKAYLKAERELMKRINETNSSEARAKLDQEERKYDRRTDKILTEVESELKRINGNSIPFFCSESLEKLHLKVGALYFIVENYTLMMQVTFVAQRDFVVDSKKAGYYSNIRYLIGAGDGSVIFYGTMSLVWLQYGQPVTITKGQTFSNYAILNVDKMSECWAEFEGILFYTFDDKEYEITPEETCMGPDYLWQYY